MFRLPLQNSQEFIDKCFKDWEDLFTMNMIEQVARKLYKQSNPEDCYDYDKTSYKEIWLIRAKAAIEAMREPTEEMVEAAFGKHDNPNPFRTAWIAMIDAALKE